MRKRDGKKRYKEGRRERERGVWLDNKRKEIEREKKREKDERRKVDREREEKRERWEEKVVFGWMSPLGSWLINMMVLVRSIIHTF